MSLFESLVQYLLLLIGVFLAVAYVYLTRHFNYWMKRGIPFVKPSPFFGSLKEVFLQKDSIGGHLMKIYHEHKHEPCVGLFAVDKPVLLLNDLEIIKDVLTKNAHYFPDHNLGSNESVDPLWAYMLIALKGQQWRHMRTKLTPTFTTGKMKLMFQLVNNCAKELVRILESKSADGSPVPVKEVLTCFTTDAISTCALGIESNALQDSDSVVRQHMRTVFEFSFKKGVRGLLMWFTPELYRFFKFKFLEKGTEKFFRDTVWQTIHYREENGVVRNDLIDSLRELRKQDLEGSGGDNGMKIDGDLLVGQVLNIFLAGFETSSAASTFSLYEMSLQPDVQNKARTEVLQVLEKYKEFTYDAVQEMKYLEMVVSESLRKYPVLGFLDRICNKEFEIQDPNGKQILKVQKGISVYIPVLGIHNDPEYYPDPDKFDPERFTEESKKNRPSSCYFPFGEGPRYCIGKRFGLMQVKTALAHILSQFEVTPCKDTPRRITFDTKSFILQSLHEIRLTFRRLPDPV